MSSKRRCEPEVRGSSGDGSGRGLRRDEAPRACQRRQSRMIDCATSILDQEFSAHVAMCVDQIMIPDSIGLNSRDET